MIINGYDFSIGADPEIFVTKDGKPVSAWGLIEGDKKNPRKVGFGAVQVDGMALEFNINPARGEAGFLRNLEQVMNTLKEMVPGYEFYDRPVAHFGREYIEAQPHAAKVLGCEPDYNAYTKGVNPTPDVETPFRTASGHIHIGWTQNTDPFDPGHFEACCTLTKFLDITLGLPSLIWDDDQERRQLYGKAGTFRPKPYGMEYRTLSNRWLRKDLPHLRKCVYGNAIEAIKKAFQNEEGWNVKIQNKSVEEVINKGDVEAAKFAGKYQNLYTLPATYRGVA